MSLRIGIDMDGTIADLSRACHAIERDLFGEPSPEPEQDETEGDATSAERDDLAAAAVKGAARRRAQLWRVIRQTPDFWTTLSPIEPGVVRRLYDEALANSWEVFFITQRPPTAGETVQRQTQRWLMAEGFDTPSVLTLSGSRGKAAAALELDFMIDDLPKNCVDIVADSKCRPLLLLRHRDPSAERAAAGLKIGVTRSVADAIDRCVEATRARNTPGVLTRMRRTLGL